MRSRCAGSRCSFTSKGCPPGSSRSLRNTLRLGSGASSRSTSRYSSDPIPLNPAIFRWLVEEREVPESPMRGMHAPSVPEIPPPVLSEEDLQRLLSACGEDNVGARRDMAIVLVFIDTGARLSEVTGIQRPTRNAPERPLGGALGASSRADRPLAISVAGKHA
jgi:site-specific recombinase XerC